VGIGYALGNAFLAVREYENWAEVLVSILKRQEPDKVILKNGFRVETEIGLRFLVRDIFFEKVYTPSNLPIEANDVVVDKGVILHSTPKAYLKRIRKIAMEFHDHLSQWHHSDVQALLEEAGFTIRLKWDKKSPLGYIYGWRD
jgi:hypothetical protein